MNRAKYLLLAICLIAILPLSMAFGPKKGFEGVIKYSIELKGVPAEQQAMMQGFMPSGFTTYIREGATRTKTEGAGMATLGMGDVLSVNGKTYFMQPDQKMAYEQPATEEGMSQEQKDEMAELKKKVKKTETQKRILGYNCQKYIIDMEDSQMGTMVLYATNELDLGGGNIKGLSSVDVTEFGIEGTPLQMEMMIQQFTMVMTATSIEAKVLEKGFFEIPKDYEIKPMADLMDMSK